MEHNFQNKGFAPEVIFLFRIDPGLSMNMKANRTCKTKTKTKKKNNDQELIYSRTLKTPHLKEIEMLYLFSHELK